MKLAFFGTSEFAVPILEAVAGRHEIVAAVTQPDRPAGRGHKLTPTPVKRAALDRAVPVLTPERLSPFVEQARALGAGAFVVASYGKIVPQALLDLVPIAFNVHPSLLPLYRGATPLQAAIRDGRRETGVTIIAMDAGMDTGDVLVQERLAIGERETYGELHDRAAALGAVLLLRAIEAFERGSLTRTPQRELGEASLTKPLRKDDLTVDWSQPAQRIVDHVRSLAPQPLARTEYGGDALKIVEARRIERRAPGEVGVILDPPGPAVMMVPRPMFAMFDREGGGVAIERVIVPSRGAMSGEAYAQRKWQGVPS